MMRYFSADYVVPVTSQPIKNGVVAVDSKGTVVEVSDMFLLPKETKVEKLEGVLIPGFVNTHCHLELSHLSGQIPEKTGLVAFIKSIMSSRKTDDATILAAMEKADQAMFENGIQAVGDHVNTSISASVKEKSAIKYHTFVEIIGLNDDQAVEKIDEARDIEFAFDAKHASITLHAPYSSSKGMWKAFKKSVSENNIVSIHNQESEEENKLYRYKTGDFLGFYEAIGYPTEMFKAQARNSIQTYLTSLPMTNKTILVHNTYTSLKDLDYVNRMGKDIIWCVCPKANLYIENTLPKLNVFVQEGVKMTIGTDSLASNSSLSILDELKVLHENFKDLDFLDTIKWATINGAIALGFDEELGSIEVGKAPGLVLLKNMTNFKVTDKVELQRIV